MHRVENVPGGGQITIELTPEEEQVVIDNGILWVERVTARNRLAARAKALKESGQAKIYAQANLTPEEIEAQ